jgi:ATP/maltotriose-dependent transcriptional regulator MalT
MHKAIDAAIASYGPHHPETIALRASLASFLNDAGRHSDALPLVLGNLESAPSPEHAMAVARTLHALGRPGDALDHLRRAMTQLGHATSAESLGYAAALADCLHESGDATTARAWCEQMADAMSTHPTPLLPAHADLAFRHATILMEAGETARGILMLRRTLAAEEAASGRRSPMVATRLRRIASLFLAHNRPSEASAMLSRAQLIAEAALGPHHPDCAAIRKALARLAQ